MKIAFRMGLDWAKTKPTRDNLAARGIPTDAIFDKSKIMFDTETIVINLGGGNSIRNAGIIINNPSNITNASNNLNTNKILRDFVPEFWESYNDNLPTPIVAKKLGGMKGRGKIVVVDHRQKYRKENRSRIGIGEYERFFPRQVTLKTGKRTGGYDFYQRFVDKTHEWRVIGLMFHQGDIIRKRIVSTYEKVRPNNVSKYKLYPNWEFHRVRNTPEAIINMVFDAIPLLGLNLVGFDIMFDGNKYYIIEANSSPGLGEPSIRRLICYITKHYGDLTNINYNLLYAEEE
jgi:glutathione synthase/RimK-type ligase-like ATP-grasp enzyme